MKMKKKEVWKSEPVEEGTAIARQLSKNNHRQFCREQTDNSCWRKRGKITKGEKWLRLVE